MYRAPTFAFSKDTIWYPEALKRSLKEKIAGWRRFMEDLKTHKT